MQLHCRFFLLFASIFFFSFQANAQNSTINRAKDTLIVGVAGSAPFVIHTDSTTSAELNGIAIDIWQGLADKANWNYKYASFSTVADALKAAQEGKVDLVVGPISITSQRLQNLSFSQPFYQSSLSIASRDDDGLWARIKPFFSLKLLYAVAGFLFILAIVGTLLWLAEHKRNPEEFSAKPGKGIGNGMWLAIVTMSTVGYGDMAPKTAFGRVVAGTWIVIAILSATSMVAGIASVVSFSGNSAITNVEQLSGKRTATISGSPAVNFIKQNKAKVVAVASIDEAMKLLSEKKVDAVVYDRPQLQYYIYKHPGLELYLSHAEYNKQAYGFAFASQRDTSFIHAINIDLFKLKESDNVKSIVESYLGENH